MMVLMAGVTTVALPPVIDKCKTCGLPIGRCQYKGKHPTKPKQDPKPKAKCKTCGKTIDKCQYGGKHPSRQSGNSGNSGSSAGMSQSQRDRILSELEANMVWVEGGTFKMGATSEQGSAANSDEKPDHQVTLSGFHICKYEVTQELWQAVMGTTVRQQRDKADPSFSLKGEGANYPMYYISWEECQTFVNKLYQLTGKRYRLPTEAEWEYAARGGNRPHGCRYAGSNNLADVAWYIDNSGSTTHPVGQKSPNSLGLYDMSGNVWEWCQDWFGSYSSGSQTNPTGPSSGSSRVFRGGCWNGNARLCRVSYRHCITPSYRHYNLGLRLARDAD